LLGLFYVIPFDAIVGDKGTALYQYGYVPYQIFLSFGTAGLPLAVSKFVSKYNTLEAYRVSRKLFKSGLFIMLITGFLSFVGLYLLAPVLAGSIIADSDQVLRLEDVVGVIRAVSYALIIVPFMSLIRGYFQGHESMGPSAVSQVVEQIVRIVFLLGGSYIILHILHGDVVQAVEVSTFAAFVGALGGLAVLLWYWWRRKPYLDRLLLKDPGDIDISLKDMYKEILIYAIPFVVVGIINSLYQMVDTLTFNRAMADIGLASVSDKMFAALNFKSHKIVIIPVSLATAFSMTLVPLITSSFVSGNYRELKNQLDQTFQVLLFLTLPAVFGISLLAEPIFAFFYGQDPSGAEVLAFYAPCAVLFSLFSVSAAILQGINEQKFTIFSMMVGLLAKMVLNIPLIHLLETKGAILATAIGYTLSVIINLGVIYVRIGYRYKIVFRRGIFITLLSLAMTGVTDLAYHLFSRFFSVESQLQALVLSGLCAFVGAGIYFYFSYKSNLLGILFPRQMKRLKGLRH
jgi:Polysaccharide biosynthesis protein.